jgi:hypothetical protein
VPYLPAAPANPSGRHKAKSNDPAGWGTRDEVQECLDGFDGLGIMFGTVGDNLHLGGVDLDLCIAPDGSVAPWAREILALGNTYAEVSPSGSGLKLFFLHDPAVTLADGRHWKSAARQRVLANGNGNARVKSPGIEFYLRVRYFTVTRCTFENYDTLRQLDLDALEAIQERMMAFAPPSRRSLSLVPDMDRPTLWDEQQRVLDAVGRMSNPDLPWNDWNRLGMAIHAATNGSAQGYAAFLAWSARSAKFDQRACDERWNHWHRSPADRLTAGSIFHWANEPSNEHRRHRPTGNGTSPPPEWGGRENDLHDFAADGFQEQREAEEITSASGAHESGTATNQSSAGTNASVGSGATGASPAAPKQAVDPRSLNDNGRSIAAVMDILRNEDTWRGVLAYDRFSLHVMLMKPAPRTGPQAPAAPWTPKTMRDVDATNALAWFHDLGLKKLTLNMLHSAMVAVAQDYAFHPVLDYFDHICAAPEPAEAPSANAHLIDPDLPEADALSLWLMLGFGAEDNKLNRAISRAFMIAMVRRVRQPGCQQDHMLVLISEEQGLHKSRGLRALIGDNWFADRLPAITTKDALIQLHGRVLIERPEVENLTEADKAFLSSSIDRFRSPYGRVAEDYPRTCSFAGTTNRQHFLDDPSGGRRYWPVEIICVGDRPWLVRNRGLIWRQACLAEAAGEAAWLNSNELQDLVRARQDAVQRPDPWSDPILERAQCMHRAWPDHPARWPGLAVNAAFLHSVFGNLSGDKMSPKDLERATKCLFRAGWRKGRGRSRYRWFPPKFRHEPEAVSNGEQ